MLCLNEDWTVMIIGSGAREHAISLAYEKSPKVKKIIVVPGNDFIAYGRNKQVIIKKDCLETDRDALLKIAEEYKPNIIDVAQDNALAEGLVDFFQEKGYKVFGPSKQAARIEWDKKWSREFMKKYNIPIPLFESFDDENKAIEYVTGVYGQEPNKAVYVKACGLCSGKGALKASSLSEAIDNIKQMHQFGESGKVFVIEEGLIGEEFSYFAILDEKNYKIFKSAQDNKTVYNFDQGEQTGGMGVISPAKVVQGYESFIEKEMIKKVVDGMIAEGYPFSGILYLGGILTKDGLKVIEYNARWGDPECQVILPGLKNDYTEIVCAAIDGNLDQISLIQDDSIRVCVVGASKGYPGNYSEAKSKEIYGLNTAAKIPGINIYGAGIKVENNKFLTNGGRLFSVVSEGENIIEARKRAYSAIAHIHIEGNNLHYRTDIGWRDVERFLHT